MRVIVTRPAAEAGEWVRALGLRGFDAIALPLMEIHPVTDTRALREAWSRITQYRAAMFVSANAARAFFAVRPGGAALTAMAWATGAGTRDALMAAGVTRIASPPQDAQQFDSEALWEVVGAQCARGDRVLIVRGGQAGTGIAGREWLAEQLAARGVKVDQLLAYVRACPTLTPPQRALASAASRDGTVWLFSSSQAIANLRDGVPGEQWSKARAIATHPRIAQAARDAGYGVVCLSRPPMEAVITALECLG